ncbi:hypothetical protein [Solicola gregarius]|uniref:Uncharacterized protein n=1 Tax=Solicola gregarius TaxID=2908642 RepID=A0AA46YPB0_9ACTN|nr:hypothetical protein [Solicola gregarius]UYM07423.1 hypothetical protein L0C25_10250 [Solicola gregarius]
MPDVLALERRVLDVCVSTGLPQPRWSKDTTPYPAFRNLRISAFEALVARDPPHPWLCITIGTGCFLLAPAGRNTV